MQTLRHLGVVLAFASLAACEGAPSATHRATGARPSALSRAELPTTDGTIALGNLDAQIEGEERLGTYGPLSVVQRAGIADLMATRGQLLGRIADYESAAALSESLVREAPEDGRALVARAQSRSVFHRFSDALADVDLAERLAVRGEGVDSLRAAIYQATGRYDGALAIRTAAAARRPDIRSLGAEATVRADLGEIGEAARLFAEAPHHYRDVSPFPVVWLYFQEGLMWMREGDAARARELFAAAHERLPGYAAAQGHLAEMEAVLGERDRAVALLRPLAETSDDPDYAAQLARILRDAGRAEESRRWREVAARRYDDLTARHPEAFADHAAEFWLAAGDDPRKALAFAKRNLANRTTARAYELVLLAAFAGDDIAAACDAASKSRAVPYAWASLRTLQSHGLAACGRQVASADAAAH